MNENQNHQSSRLNEETLLDSAAFRLLTEKIPVLVYVYQGEHVIYVNSTVEETLGYTREELLQMHYWDIAHLAYKDLIRTRGHARLRGENVPSNYEVQIEKKSGEVLWVDVFFARTELHGQPMTIVGAYDITEKKLLQDKLLQAHDELESRVEQRTSELSEAIHELTTLNDNLNNIIKNMSEGVVLIYKSGESQFLNAAIESNWDTMLPYFQGQLKDDILAGKTGYLKRMLIDQIPFVDEEIIFTSPLGSTHFLASGTPVINQFGVVDRGVMILRPIHQIHKLVNRFVGAQASYTFEDIITQNPQMQIMIDQAKKAALSMNTVLIQGESGTGKEMFAQAIHLHSARCKGPFVAVNCGAIPRDLVGSELFGYVEGAFTGAKKGGNPGKFELASEGTLFLDEIGDMPFEQQVTLLRVIQEKKVNRIGSAQPIPVDVRIICATHTDLRSKIQQGSFRHDLFYRLNVIALSIPPLRDRPEDIALLFTQFLSHNSSFNPSNSQIFEPQLGEALKRYEWPGNVRELQNVVERMLLNAGGMELTLKHLPEDLFSGSVEHETPTLDKTKVLSLWEARQEQLNQLEEVERRQIMRLLTKHQGNLTAVAREMGIARSTLYKKMKNYTV